MNQEPINQDPEGSDLQDDVQEEFEVDPAMAAAMGFSSFGNNAPSAKRRKVDHAFVDPTPKLTGSNALPARHHHVDGSGRSNMEAKEKGKSSSTFILLSRIPFGERISKR